MNERTDNPGVRFPPPFLYLIPILGGPLLHRQWPLPMADAAGLDLAAALGVVVWVLLAFPSLLKFRAAGTSPLPFRPASALVTSGAYRFSRNPMYLGFAVLTLATGPMFDTWWPIVLLPPTLYLVQRLVIVPEERYLRRRFGVEYEAYVRRVRRWI